MQPRLELLDRELIERILGEAFELLMNPGVKVQSAEARELWQPRLMDRRPYGQWAEKHDGARDWARDRAQKILKEHQPDPLDPKLVAELQRVIQSVEK